MEDGSGPAGRPFLGSGKTAAGTFADDVHEYEESGGGAIATRRKASPPPLALLTSIKSPENRKRRRTDVLPDMKVRCPTPFPG